MISEKENTRISKFLSLVLRHQPETLGILLNEGGWTEVKTLIEKMNNNGFDISLPTLEHVVSNNLKKRFAFNHNKTLIRASQGHSVDIELGYQPAKPPTILYHGTGAGSLSSILKEGLDKRSRHMVHLSNDLETAIKVGQRHGKPKVLVIESEKMFDEGFKFFLSENNVWLTDSVPAKYLKEL